MCGYANVQMKKTEAFGLKSEGFFVEGENCFLWRRNILRLEPKTHNFAITLCMRETQNIAFLRFLPEFQIIKIHIAITDNVECKDMYTPVKFYGCK